MGLFSKREKSVPAPRMALEERTVTPTTEQLTTYLWTAGGSYHSSPEDKDPETWQAMRSAADKWMKQLGVTDRHVKRLAYLVPGNTPDVIWVEVDGVRVDRLTRSAVAAWNGQLTEPLPVVCNLMQIGGKGYERPSVTLYTKREKLG
jgi:hypothetical protein